MADAIVRIIIGYMMVVGSWIFAQVSRTADGIINRGFDAGLSIGLLIVGLIVLGWYHWKYQKYSRELIGNMADQHDKKIDKLNVLKDQKTEQLHVLALQQIELTKDQIQTNKELRAVVQQLDKNIERLSNAQE